MSAPRPTCHGFPADDAAFFSLPACTCGDLPALRRLDVCPLCDQPKARGLVTCWPCYRRHDGRGGFPGVAAILTAAEAFAEVAEAEAAVALAEQCECGAPGVHPYPIGGGWALACDRCKVRATRKPLGLFSDERFAEPEDWDRWRIEAEGGAP